MHTRGPLAGQDYWATPGGALEADESFEEAAGRELFEETGILMDAGSQVADQEFVLQLPDGEYVLAEERFFLVRAANQPLSQDHWTPLENEVITDHHSWSVEELVSTTELIYPESLVAILAGITNPDSSPA